MLYIIVSNLYGIPHFMATVFQFFQTFYFLVDFVLKDPREKNEKKQVILEPHRAE